jgi:hypothetical protein
VTSYVRDRGRGLTPARATAPRRTICGVTIVPLLDEVEGTLAQRPEGRSSLEADQMKD